MRVFCESDDSGKDYDITVVDGKLVCDCPDFRYRRQSRGEYCKHLVEFAEEFQNVLPAVEPTYAYKLAETINMLDVESYSAPTRDRTNINSVMRYLGGQLAEEVLNPS